MSDLPHAEVPELAAILNRPSDYALAFYDDMPACHCEGCEAERARPFHCDACGFSGVPLVWPCTCVSSDERHEEALRRAVEQAGTQKRDRVFGRTREQARTALADFLSEHRRGPCPGPDGAVWCAHFGRDCPVCTAAEGAETADGRGGPPGHLAQGARHLCQRDWDPRRAARDGRRLRGKPGC
jgi:hypothetical protein